MSRNVSGETVSKTRKKTAAERAAVRKMGGLRAGFTTNGKGHRPYVFMISSATKRREMQRSMACFSMWR